MSSQDRKLFWALLAIIAALLLNLAVANAPACYVGAQTQTSGQNASPPAPTDAAHGIGSIVAAPFCAAGNLLYEHRETIGAAAILAIPALLLILIGIMGKLWCEMKRPAQNSDAPANGYHDAVETMRAANRIALDAISGSRRPWISIDDVSLIGPTTVARGGSSVVLSIVTKNVGISPARNVNILADARCPGTDDEREEILALRERSRKQSRAGGAVVFPNTNLNAQVSWEFGQDIMALALAPKRDGQETCKIHFLISVSYQIEDDPEPKITQLDFSVTISAGFSLAKDQRYRLTRNPSGVYVT